MAMHEALKKEMIGLKVSIKASVSTVEKLESRMALKATDFSKLQQDVKVALKNKWSKRPLEEPRDDAPKLLKVYHVSLKAAVLKPVLPDADKKRKGCCYSLTGITSGELKKQTFELKRKTCHIFAKDWPKWLTVEGAFDFDLDWVCVSEATFVDNLVRIYPNTTFLMWKPDMVLPLVNFVFCYHWLPLLSNKIWHFEVFEALLASAEKFRST
jgi:hypothetical protein